MSSYLDKTGLEYLIGKIKSAFMPRTDIDTTPTCNSNNLVTSGGVHSYVNTQVSTYTSAMATDSLVVHKAGTETVTGNKTFSGTTTFTGVTKLGSNATATTPASWHSDCSVATTAFVHSAIVNTTLSCGYAPAATASDVAEGDTYATAIGKLDRIIADNEQAISGALNVLDSRVCSVATCIGILSNEVTHKLTKLTCSTNNAVVRFGGICGDIRNSGVIIDDCNNVTAAKFITDCGSGSQFVKGDGSLDGRTYIDACSLPYWANIRTEMGPRYANEPEFKSVKINGIDSTCIASTENAVIQYDTATKVVKFVFN